MRRGGKSSQNGQVPSKGRSPGRTICSLPALSLGSQQECSGKASWGRGKLGKGGLGGGKRSPQLTLANHRVPRRGASAQAASKVSPKFSLPGRWGEDPHSGEAAVAAGKGGGFCR